jgi:DNA repair photolyase
VLRRAKAKGLSVGVILAPIFPPTASRPDFAQDLHEMAEALRPIKPDHVYGESLHIRGENTRLVRDALGEEIVFGNGFDRTAERVFHGVLDATGLSGTWWPEHRG